LGVFSIPSWRLRSKVVSREPIRLVFFHTLPVLLPAFGSVPFTVFKLTGPSKYEIYKRYSGKTKNTINLQCTDGYEIAGENTATCLLYLPSNGNLHRPISPHTRPEDQGRVIMV